MKKDGKLYQALACVFVLPIAILMVLFLLLYTPIDFVRYCFSNRRREMKHLYGKRAKYSWIITFTHHYRIFELIAKSSLPISFIPAFENPCQDGYFYYNQTLFLHDIVPHYDVENGTWYIVREHDESDLSVYMEAEKEDFYKCAGFNENMQCERIIFLVEEEDVYDEEKVMVEKSDFILTYNEKNFADKINAFLSK